MWNIQGTQTANPTAKGSGPMLLRQIERFLRRVGMTATKFGRLAARDPRFVADLRSGRIPRARTAARVEEFMKNYQENVHAH